VTANPVPAVPVIQKTTATVNESKHKEGMAMDDGHISSPFFITDSS
jgi:hypothetical protein